MKIIAGLVASLFVASAAQAAVYDFTGFTVSLEGTGWDSYIDYDNSGTYDNESYSDTNGWTTTPNNINYSSAGLSFSKPAFAELEATGVGDSQSSPRSFSYSVQAKNGWQLSGASFSLDEGGAYVAYKGGSASVTDGGFSSTYSGNPWGAYGYGSAGQSAYVQTANIESGSWYSYAYQGASGNWVTGNFEYLYDQNGNYSGYKHTYSLTDYYTPLTAISGSGSYTLGVSTNGMKQIAAFDQDYAYGYLSVSAVQQVSPVPEPETYAMMLGGLGVLGFAARRRKQKEAAKLA